MRAKKWAVTALCAVTMLLGGLMMETAPSLFQSAAAADEGTIECTQVNLSVESAASETAQDCCLDPIEWTVAGGAEPQLTSDDVDLHSADGKPAPTFDPCCDQTTVVAGVQSADGLNSANGSPTDPCLTDPCITGTVTNEAQLQSADAHHGATSICCDEPTFTVGGINSANGSAIDPCLIDPCLTTTDTLGPICCADAPGVVVEDDLLQSADVRPGGPSGLCVPVCAIPLYVPMIEQGAVFSAASEPTFPPCIPICGTEVDGNHLELSSSDAAPTGMPTCVPICGPASPANAALSSASIEDGGAPPCILPCGPVDLVETNDPYATALSSASVGPTDGPAAPPCVPPCVSSDVPLSDTISSANMRRHGGPPPIEPCIEPCPNNVANPAVESSGFIILCDPCVSGTQSAGLASDTAPEPTTPVENPVLQLDGDCDNVPQDVDCDDDDRLNMISTTDDADCDGVPTTTDCDDTDDSITNTNVTDADCDGVPTTTDCDDDDKLNTISTTDDADCDLIPTADDCNDMDATNLCISLEDPYTCAQGFQGSIGGGAATYNVSYSLTPSAGGATTMLPTFVVASAGAFTTPAGYIDYSTINGPHQVMVTVTDFNARSTSVSFEATLTNVCGTEPAAPAVPGISDAEVEEILKVIVANREADATPEVVSELDVVTAAPAVVARTGGALALTGAASRMLAMLALIFLGFGMTFVGTDRLRQLLPDEDDD